jgi:DNA replication licensing factor MCM6
VNSININFDQESQGLRRNGLVSWYLREIEGDIDSEAELIERKTIVEKVIDRLVQHVSLVNRLEVVFTILLFF